jgi:hypothetical protein
MRLVRPSDSSRRRLGSHRSARAVARCAADVLERRVMLSNVIPIGEEFRVNGHTSTSKEQPSTAMDARGDFVVTWDSFGQDGSLTGVYAQRYAARGTPLGSEFRVNTHTTGHQRFSSIAMEPDGDFVVAWAGGGPGDFSGIFAQRYNAAGAAQGDQFRVNTYTTDNQLGPSVAVDADGDFVVAWTSYRQDASPGYGVYAQRFDASGARQGGEFRVNTYTTDIQSHPSVAMDADGDFVVGWISDGQDGSSSGVFAQRYNATAVPQGGEFRVNTYTFASQTHPSVAMDAAGNLVVAWISGQGSTFNVYAQRYSATGAAQGGEFRVSTSGWLQQFPVVAMDRDGDFVVAWQGYPQEQAG